jgi:hypothetical protein
LGLSLQHASEVPLVLNLGTGAITTQFHVVFDDLFTTVPSIERETEPPDHWADVCLENSTRIMMDSPIENLGDEWSKKRNWKSSVVVKIGMKELERRTAVYRAFI